MNNPRRIQRHLVKALAAGALFAAAALPLAIATAASAAAGSLTAIAFTPAGATTNSTGVSVAGSTGTATFTGTGFANNGATNDTLVATCTGASTLTFNTVAETSATTGTADFVATGTAASTCSVVLTDANGAAGALAGAAVLDASPTITSISPASVWEGTGPTTVTIGGLNYATGAKVTLTNHVDGTILTSSVTSVSATSIVLSVTPTNSATSGAATTGAYDVSISNTDGGAVLDASAFAVNNGLENVSPSAVPLTIGSYPIALLGSGFQYGAQLTLTTNGVTPDAGACITDITNAGAAPTAPALPYSISGATITSPTAGTATIVVTTAPGAAIECALSVTNTGTGNNGDIFPLVGALGFGEASIVAPVISSAAPATPINVGAAATTVTLTGSGFSSFSTVTTPPAAGDDVVYSAANGAAGTSLTFNAAATSGVVAGPVIVTVNNPGTSTGSTTYTPAITVAGPAITSQAPNLVQGSAFGTTITLTGTGFTNTTTGTVTGGASGLAGTVAYLTPTTMSLVVTTSPTGTTGASVQLSDVTATGTVKSTAFALTIDAPPLVTGLVTYAVGAGSDVGVGATAQTVYIHGSGFLTGATVTAFVNGAGVADPNVTATVTAVTATQITATVAIKAPDTNAAVGYTVTNTDGGTAKVAAFSWPIFIGAGPTITSVTPTTGAAAATTSFALAGTGFGAGAVVTLSPSNGTCGAATVSASTTLAVTCTLGTPGVTPTSLVVTNTDGGSATSSPVLAAAAPPAPKFHVSGVHGAAVAGTWATVQITGTGFYGQPKITGGAPGSKFAVTKDTGRALTVKIYTKPGVSGEHSLTVHLANGKSGKAGYNVKA